MIKKFFLILAISFGILNATYYEANDKNFKDGFEAGLEALKFQKNADGFNSRLIEIKEPFLLTYDIKNYPLNEALFIQLLSARQGFNTHLTKEFISFGGYEREIDAKDKMKSLASKFKLNLKDFKIQKNIKEIITYPFLYKLFYDNLLQEAIKSGVIIEVKILEKPIVKKNIKNKPIKTFENKYPLFYLKNSKAMGYSLIGSEQDSKNFIENGFITKNTFKLEKTITTLTGEKFVKVVGENLYFSIKDVRVKK